MGEIKLEVKNARKSYGEEVAVDGLTLSVEERMIKSLLGPSGCGKTTTLRCIAGLEELDGGEIYIDGNLVSAPAKNINVPPKDRGIGMVFQSYALWPHMTVRQNVMYPLKFRRMEGSKAEKNEKVEEILETVGLGAHVDDLSSQLSGGQQQRVALARALVSEPEILLMDEPLSSLDAKLRRDMRKELLAICKSFDATVLYVTHSQDEAMFLSDEIALMQRGAIVEEAPPASLYEFPATEFGMDFMGESNRLESTVVTADEESVTLDNPLGEFTLGDLEHDLGAGDRVRLYIRPKHCLIVLDEVRGGLVTGEGTGVMTSDEVERAGIQGSIVEGKLVAIGETRDYTAYEFDLDGIRLLVRTSTSPPLEHGDSVKILLPADRLRIFSDGTVRRRGTAESRHYGRGSPRATRSQG